MKIWNSVCSTGWTFCSIDRSDKENDPEAFAWLDCCLIPIWSIEKSHRSILNSSWSVETCKTKFFGNYFECLKRFQALWTVKWKFLTFHTCLLMKYNPMGINSGSCSLDSNFFFSLPKKLVSMKYKKSCGCSLELLFIEPNKLVVSWGQVCNNPIAIIVWGKILFKDNNYVPPSYLFSICLLC